MTITQIDPLPELKRADPDFPEKVDDFFGEKLPKHSRDLNALAAGIVTVAQGVNDKAGEAAGSAGASAASAAASTASAAETQQYAQLAQEAMAASPVPAFVAGQTYAVGDVCYSPSNFENYRAMTAGVRTVDPRLDPTNWYWLGSARAQTAAMLWAFALD